MRVYPSGLAAIDWTNDSLVCLLLRTTSADRTDEVSFNPLHTSLADLWGAGAVEIDVAGYARQSLVTNAPVIDAAANRATFDAADLDFGHLTAGQNVYAMVLFRDGADDESTTLIAFDNGTIALTLAADAPSGSTLVWVEPLAEALPTGALVDLGSGAIGSLQSAAAKGARLLSLTAPGLGAAASAGSRCEEVRTARLSTQATPPALAYLNNGHLRIDFNAEGVLIVQPQGV